MKLKSKAIIILSLLIFALAAGCTEKPVEQTTKPVKSQEKVLTGQLKIDGSPEPYLIADKAAVAFRKLNPGVNITVNYNSTGDGYKKLLAGEIDMVLATRTPKDSEYAAAKEKGITLYMTILAHNAVAVVVHPSNPLSDISLKQLQEIYFNASIKDWKQLTNGTKTGKINLYSPDQKLCGSADIFTRKLGYTKFANGTKMMYPITTVVPAVANDTNAIGYTPLTWINLADVKVVKVEGVSPTKETILDSTYGIPYDIYLVTNGPPQDVAKEFVNYMLGKDTQLIVVEEGFIPLT